MAYIIKCYALLVDLVPSMRAIQSRKRAGWPNWQPNMLVMDHVDVEINSTSYEFI